MIDWFSIFGRRQLGFNDGGDGGKPFTDFIVSVPAPLIGQLRFKLLDASLEAATMRCLDCGSMATPSATP